jgi:gamma-glutamyl hercynylcysteine S-oxide synthase
MRSSSVGHVHSDRDPTALIGELRDTRAHLTRVTARLDGERLLGPYLAIVNPPLWELGHVAWFQEYWCLRRKHDGSAGPSVMTGSDALYDSARIEHARRWSLPLPSLGETQAYQAEVLGRVIDRVEREPENAALLYFVRLAAYHEDMHAEAFRYTCQTLAYEDPLASTRTGRASSSDPPIGTLEPSAPTRSENTPPVAASGDVELAGGAFELGAARDGSFVFDNEKWAHRVFVEPFSISRTAVTNREFLAFVEAGGYARQDWWSEDGWRWVREHGRNAPTYWTKRDGVWLQRRFDGFEALADDEPVVHVSWHEAQAYCAFAKRRLPSEAEWEFAAAHDGASGVKRFLPWGAEPASSQRANLEGTGLAPVTAHADGDAPSGCRQMIGNTWEWTSSAFGPYPGFEIDPYKEYSEPWFHTHKVLRGGSFATPRRLVRNTFRNFYLPERADVFAGFRTCAR